MERLRGWWTGSTVRNPATLFQELVGRFRLNGPCSAKRNACAHHVLIIPSISAVLPKLHHTTTCARCVGTGTHCIMGTPLSDPFTGVPPSRSCFLHHMGSKRGRNITKAAVMPGCSQGHCQMSLHVSAVAMGLATQTTHQSRRLSRILSISREATTLRPGPAALLARPSGQSGRASGWPCALRA